MSIARFAVSPISPRKPDVLCGGLMIRLDLSYFYRLGVTLNELRHLSSEATVDDVWVQLYDARDAIDRLLSNSVIGSSLRGAMAHGSSLSGVLNEIINREMDNPFSIYDRNNVLGAFNRFEIVIASEMAICDAYFILEKKPFSTLTLIAEGEALFPIDLPRKVPEAVLDLREAGKCIAFELPTASAFHTHRAIEAILRRYWEAVTGNKPKPKQRNIGVYLDALTRMQCGDAKVISALTQIKDLHRNVVIHPEESLSNEDALALIGIANSVASAMLKELPFVEATIVPPDNDVFPSLEIDDEHDL